MLYEQVKLTTKAQKIDNPFTKSLRVVHGTLPRPISRPAYGIDPGVNFGLTVIEENKVYVFNGSLMSDEKPGRRGLIAYKFLQDMLGKFASIRCSLMVIEGASYGDQYGQVLLSEVRTGFYLAASLWGGFSDVEIVAPTKIRKQVFGDGKVRAPDEWPLLNKNAADSLAMALYATLYMEV